MMNTCLYTTVTFHLGDIHEIDMSLTFLDTIVIFHFILKKKGSSLIKLDKIDKIKREARVCLLIVPKNSFLFLKTKNRVFYENTF